jgi:hypothetical protein
MEVAESRRPATGSLPLLQWLPAGLGQFNDAKPRLVIKKRRVYYRKNFNEPSQCHERQ